MHDGVLYVGFTSISNAALKPGELVLDLGSGGGSLAS